MKEINMMVRCEICGKEYQPLQLGHPLHPANWSAEQFRTADVCSLTCKSLFIALISNEKALNDIKLQIQKQRRELEALDKLNNIAGVISEDISAEDKITKIRDLFDENEWGGDGWG